MYACTTHVLKSASSWTSDPVWAQVQYRTQRHSPSRRFNRNKRKFWWNDADGGDHAGRSSKLPSLWRTVCFCPVVHRPSPAAAFRLLFLAAHFRTPNCGDHLIFSDQILHTVNTPQLPQVRDHGVPSSPAYPSQAQAARGCTRYFPSSVELNLSSCRSWSSY